jgi:hypothetical protein
VRDEVILASFEVDEIEFRCLDDAELSGGWDDGSQNRGEQKQTQARADPAPVRAAVPGRQTRITVGRPAQWLRRMPAC